MTQNQTYLIQRLQSPSFRTGMYGLAYELQDTDFSLADLVSLTLNSNQKIAFRAAWLLEHVVITRAELYIDYLEELIARGSQVTNKSCQRHYAKIYQFITSKNAPQQVRKCIQCLDLEPITEQCFDWLLASEVKVAVKVFAAEVLYNLRLRYSWIDEELSSRLLYLMRNGSPAMQTAGRRMLSKMLVA